MKQISQSKRVMLSNGFSSCRNIVCRYMMLPLVLQACSHSHRSGYRNSHSKVAPTYLTSRKAVVAICPLRCMPPVFCVCRVACVHIHRFTNRLRNFFHTSDEGAVPWGCPASFDWRWAKYRTWFKHEGLKVNYLRKSKSDKGDGEEDWKIEDSKIRHFRFQKVGDRDEGPQLWHLKNRWRPSRQG